MTLRKFLKDSIELKVLNQQSVIALQDAKQFIYNLSDLTQNRLRDIEMINLAIDYHISQIDLLNRRIASVTG